MKGLRGRGRERERDKRRGVLKEGRGTRGEVADGRRRELGLLGVGEVGVQREGGTATATVT